MDTPVHTHEMPVGDRETLGLLLADLAILAVLVTYGYINHGGSPLSEPLGAFETILPFAIGWILLAVLTGVYVRGVFQSPTRVAQLTFVAWLGAANVGLILRSSPLFDGGSAYPFNLIMTAIGVFFLGGWRVGYALWVQRY